MKIAYLKLLVILLCYYSLSYGQNTSYKIGLLKYNGGGDWYANPTALSNLIWFCNQELGTNIDPVYDEISVGDQAIYNYPFIYWPLTKNKYALYFSNFLTNLLSPFAL